MSRRSIWIDEAPALNYFFGEHHPFNQRRITLTRDLLQVIDALPASSVVRAEAATDEDLLRVHEAEYVAYVKQLVDEQAIAAKRHLAARFGLGEGDTPAFPGMHRTTAHVVGGTIAAVEAVMAGECEHALHLGGGLHHAMPDRAAGFCVYNDAAVAISRICERYGAKVLYVDTDVHHGDGVQEMFYDNENVFTFSIHENGRYLFPGTGGLHERGTGAGRGYCLNMPMEPNTEDDDWLKSFEQLVETIVLRFKPDMIVSQHGCDAHIYDPLAHIRCSMLTYRRMPQTLHRLAHEHCDGRWVALGGGGYDIWRVVPRAWSLLWLEMSDHPLLDELDRNERLPLPEHWKEKWRDQSPHPLPDTWLDEKDAGTNARREQIRQMNESTLHTALTFLEDDGSWQ